MKATKFTISLVLLLNTIIQLVFIDFPLCPLDDFYRTALYDAIHYLCFPPRLLTMLSH